MHQDSHNRKCGARILIVDDEPGIRDLLEKLLCHHGYEVATAADAEAAIVQIGGWLPELVITDMVMPGMSGGELMHAVHEHLPTLPFIVITGNPRLESAVELIKSGAADYITKPFQLNEILVKIHHVLIEARQRRQNAYVGTIFGMRLSRIGNYQIDSILGEGANGVVFRATQDGQGERGEWVVKVFKIPGDSNSAAREAALQRFHNEAAIGRELRHPGIVSIIDHGLADDGAIPYLVMRYIQGRTMRDVIDSDLPAPRESCRLLAQIADALAAVHAHGVIHRDIKPGNVMLHDGQAILMDFSIARVPDSSLTRAEMILGSPAYMAPEAFLGCVVDARADLFSLGITAYELLTGTRPFIGDTLARFAQVIPVEKPLNPVSVNPAVTPAMARVLARLLKKKPNERYQDAASVAADLRAAADAPAEPDGTVCPESWQMN